MSISATLWHPKIMGEPYFWVANLLLSFYMLGFMWFIQTTHYRLFHLIAPERFTVFESQHQKGITPLVAPAMILELIVGTALVISPLPYFPPWMAGLNLVLVLITWLVTFLWSVPQHVALSRGYQPDAHRRLLRSHLVRTLAWTGKAVTMTWSLVLYLRP